MAAPSKRLPICGVLSLAAALGAWILFCWMWNPPAFIKNDAGRGIFWLEMLTFFCMGTGFGLGVVALVRRERFSAACLVSALIVNGAIVGLILTVMALLSQHMEGH